MANIDKEKLSQEAKGKYSVESNAFLMQKIKNAEKDKYDGKPKDEINVIVGDDKQPDKFYPQVKLERWSNEVNFSVRLKENEADLAKSATIITDKDKIVWEKGNIKIENYESDEENYKFVWYLKKKPTTNKIQFSIQSKGLDFFYQPELTQEEKDKGAFRPENVVGSYAVYHSTKGGMVDGNGKDYKTGKAFHIYRPHIIDANGLETWGILKIENGIYSVEIPQDFLDKAVYPVKSNDTFGYNQTGTSGTNVKNLIRGHIEMGGAGTGVSMQAYCWALNGNSSARIKYAIYLDSDGSLLSNGTTNASGTLGASFNRHWEILNFTSAPTISAVNYKIVAWANYDVYVGYDNTANTGVYETATYGTWPASITWERSGRNERFFIYATYTPAAAGVVKTVNGLAIASIKTINGLAVASVKTINGAAYQ
jgi:hypothetical protein